jgi:hypothetical protein
MAEEKVVPTGPKGAVRTSDDDSRPIRMSGQNPDPRDNTPTAEQQDEARRRGGAKGENEPTVDKQGHKSYGGGGQKLKFERDYWPAQQPENKFDPNDIDPATGRPRPLLVHREHVIRAGEIASVPGEEADKLIEAGAAKQYKEKKE